MAYTIQNFKTKKELKAAVTLGVEVRLQVPFIGQPKRDGIEWVEGPHSPAPHAWAAEVTLKDGRVIKVR